MSRICFPLSVVLPIFVVLLATGGVAFGLDFPPMAAGENDIEPTLAEEDDFRSSPVMFIENVGQWNKNAEFQIWGGAGNAMWLTDDAIWITVMGPEARDERSEVGNQQPEESRGRVPDDAPRGGIRSLEHLEGMGRAAELELDSEILARLNEIFDINRGRALKPGPAPEAFAW